MRRIVSCCIAMGALGAVMVPSAYADNNFSCRGSAARVQAPLLGTVEPGVANGPNDPCVTDNRTVIAISAGSILKTSTANAKTTNSATQSTAFGSVENAVVNVGVVGLKADVVTADAAATCANGQPALSGSSKVTNLKATVLGLPVSVNVGTSPNTTLLNVAGVKVVLNEQTTANGEKTVRAIHVAAGALGIDVVLAEARADYHGNPCGPPPPTQCNDGVDNGDPEDTLADANDPGCHTDGNAGNQGSYDPNDNDESNKVECNDGVDNADTEDALADANDPGCHTDGNGYNPNSYNPYDPSESNVGTQCNDGVDNADPEDTLVDIYDPGCHTDANPGNPGSYVPSHDDETDGPPPAQCSDGRDNDGDGKIDFPNDPGCSGPNDDDETDPLPKTQCNNGIDDDGDGKIDFPNDPGCSSLSDNSESPDPKK